MSREYSVEQLIAVVGCSIEDFFDLSTTLAFRSCSRALQQRYHPSQAAALWQRVKPPLARFLQIRCLTLEAVQLYGATLTNYAEWTFAAHELIKRACREGRIGILRWVADSGNMGPSRPAWMFVKASRAGQLAVAKWIVAKYPREQFRPYGFMGRLAAMGDLEFAQWAIEESARVGDSAESTNLTIFAVACGNGNFQFATWVLNRFPLDFSSELPRLLLCLSLQSGRALRWVIETLNLDWGAVGSQNDSIAHNLKLKDQATANWYAAWRARVAPP